MKVRAILLVSMFVCASVYGGILELDCTFPDDPTGEDHDWIFEVDNAGTPGKTSDDVYLLTLIETLEVDYDTVMVSGLTDSDPVVSITKTVTNDNCIDWTGYIINLGGIDVYFDYSVLPTSDVFMDVDTSDPMQIVFSNGTVPVTTDVTFTFNIHVETIGQFQYCLEQIAIPEPATLLLLGVGGLLLRRRK